MKLFGNTSGSRHVARNIPVEEAEDTYFSIEETEPAPENIDSSKAALADIPKNNEELPPRDFPNDEPEVQAAIAATVSASISDLPSDAPVISSAPDSAPEIVKEQDNHSDLSNEEAYTERKIVKKKKNKKDLLKKLTIGIAVLIIIVAAVIIGYSIWEKPPEINNNISVNQPVTPSPTPGQSVKPTPTESTGTSDDNDNQPDETEPPEETAPSDEDEEEESFEGALVTERNDGVYTCMLLGRDEASGSTDTIIVARFDTKNHTIDAVNIPRDTLINISWDTTPKKINAVYPGYTNSGKSGVRGLKLALKDLLGFDVDCYCIVSVDAVTKIVDAIGGVNFNVPIDMDYDDPAQNFHVHLKKGNQLLKGKDAIGVFRFRYGNNGVGTYSGGDLQRIGVQQDLLKAIASQVLTLGNIPNLADIIQILADSVETDLTAQNIAFFARQFLKCDMSSISFSTMPYTEVCSFCGYSYVSCDVQAWLDMINEKLNPFVTDITWGNVSILTSNYNGTNITSTSGIIAGGIDSFYDCTCGFAHNPSFTPEQWKALLAQQKAEEEAKNNQTSTPSSDGSSTAPSSGNDNSPVETDTGADENSNASVPDNNTGNSGGGSDNPSPSTDSDGSVST